MKNVRVRWRPWAPPQGPTDGQGFDRGSCQDPTEGGRHFLILLSFDLWNRPPPVPCFYFMYSFDYQFIYPLIMKRFHARIQWRDSIERTQRKGFKWEVSMKGCKWKDSMNGFNEGIRINGFNEKIQMKGFNERIRMKGFSILVKQSYIYIYTE